MRAESQAPQYDTASIKSVAIPSRVGTGAPRCSNKLASAPRAKVLRCAPVSCQSRSTRLMPSTPTTTLLAHLTTAVSGRRIAFLHARLPGLLECALVDAASPMPLAGDDPPPLDGTLLLSLRAGTVGVAVLAAGRSPLAMIPADLMSDAQTSIRLDHRAPTC